MPLGLEFHFDSVQLLELHRIVSLWNGFCVRLVSSSRPLPTSRVLFPTAAAMAHDEQILLDQIAKQHGLHPTAWEHLLALAQRRSCAVGEVLFDEGDFNSNLYLLVEGQVDLAMRVTGRGAVKILSLGPGDIIAWSAMLGAGRMTCRATSVSMCRLIFWKQDVLEALGQKQPDFGLAWMRFVATALSNRLLATRLQLLDLFSANSGSQRG